MKDTYDFTYAQDLRHFIGLLLDDYCPTQLKIFDSDIVYDVIKDLKQFKMVTAVWSVMHYSIKI